MKKLLMVLAFASVSMAGMAQEDKFSVATNSFWSNWFVQVNAVGSSFFADGEKWAKPFKDYRTNLGASVAIGKWFTPGLGLRTKVKGIWGRQIIEPGDKDVNAMKYWTLNEEVLFNLSNMLCGYNPDRVWNFVPYLGGSLARNMSENQYAMGLNFGILNTWRLSNRIRLNLDLSFTPHEADFGNDAMHNPDANRALFENKDREINAEIGLTFNLGKGTWNKVPDVDAIKALYDSQIDALNDQLNAANAENERLNNLIKNHKCPDGGKVITVEKVIAAPVSVFFNIGSAQIASKKDLVNVQSLVDVAKANDKTIVVTASADSQTGSAELNQRLSEKRAETVKAELVKMGVDESKIQVVAKGGVNDIDPFAYNRRAVVEVK